MIDSIEDVRRYWDSRPCNIRHSDLPVGTRDYFKAVSSRKYAVEPHIPKFANFKAWKAKTVLEIGCGIGTDAERFAVCGAIYTGIDISQKSVNLARLRLDQCRLLGTFIVGDAERLTELLPPQRFDLVYSFGAIHHTPEPKRIVECVKHYMDQDSEFRLMLYAKDSWKDIMIEAGLDRPEAQAGCPIAKTFTRPEVCELLKDFDIISIEQTHIFPFVVEDYVEHRYKVQPWFKSMPNKMFHALERRLGWHLLIVAKMKHVLDKTPYRA